MKDKGITLHSLASPIGMSIVAAWFLWQGSALPVIAWSTVCRFGAGGVSYIFLRLWLEGDR